MSAVPDGSEGLTVVVVGGSGFIGSAVVRQLRDQGHVARAVRAPRLTCAPDSVREVVAMALVSSAVAALATELAGADVVVNAAGDSDATSASPAVLLGANAVLPRVVREAARQAGAGRFLHISSAGVQGRRPLLDESSSTSEFSPYTRSKALGEAGLADCPEAVVFRPTSVHGLGRAVTASLAGLAKTRFASVAGSGDRPTPQVLVDNVGSAVAFVATYPGPVPARVLQPPEGLTTGSLLEALGARRVHHVPVGLARLLLALVWVGGRFHAKFAALARRLEMLWFGQGQVAGWLADTTWRPVADLDDWRRLAVVIQDDALA